MIRTKNVTPYGVQIATNLQSNVDVESIERSQANDMSIDGFNLKPELKVISQAIVLSLTCGK